MRNGLGHGWKWHGPWMLWPWGTDGMQRWVRYYRRPPFRNLTLMRFGPLVPPPSKLERRLEETMRRFEEVVAWGMLVTAQVRGDDENAGDDRQDDEQVDGGDGEISEKHGGIVP